MTKKRRLWLNIGTAIAMIGALFVFGGFVNPPYDRAIGPLLLSILFVRQLIGQHFKRNGPDLSNSQRRRSTLLLAGQISLIIVIAVAGSLLPPRISAFVGLAIFWAFLFLSIVLAVLAERRSTKNAEKQEKADSDTPRSDLVEGSEDRR